MPIEQADKLRLEEFLEEMKEYKARHTELITVYVPKGFSINLITKQLESEKSTASNIKSTATRKNVQDALESLIRLTKGMKKTPKNGVALFAGNVSQIEGQDNFITEVFEPPEELNVRLYRCDQAFVLEPLEEMLEVKEVYGLVAIDRREATLGLLVGKKIRILQKVNSYIPGKTEKGGQSAARFARIREGIAKEFYRKVAELIKKEFFNLKNLQGILLGGPGPTKEEFLKEGNLATALQDKIIAIKDIGYADEHGIELLIESSQDVLAEQEITHEKQIMEKFFDMLGKQKDKTAYKQKAVEKALDYGAVDTLFLSKKLKKADIKKFEKKASETDVKVELVSVDTGEGVQFWGLGGIGAILRFAI